MVVSGRLEMVIAYLAVFVSLVFLGFNAFAAQAEEMAPRASSGLPLSEMTIEISSAGEKATFRLYDTVAARELYAQLPLRLDLTNFRDAQWMFYPPEKLNVSDREVYHDGKKGELSYYEPWGDVFMLYRDFHAGDAMHRLGFALSGADRIAEMTEKAVIRQVDGNTIMKESAMQIRVSTEGQEIIFQLNDSKAAKSLYEQLPMTLDVENYSSNEKIFYPPRKLDTGNTPLASKCEEGTLAYYAPWGDVVMFYGTFGSASGLYELGEAVRGGNSIRSLSGTIRVEAVSASD